MKKYIIAILLCLPFLLSGCFNFENIKLVAIKDATYKEYKDNVLRFDVTMTINNPNKMKVKISNANINLMLGDRVIGVITQMDQVELAGQTQKDYTICMAVNLQDITSNMISLFRILMNELDQLSLSGSVHAKSFIYSREIQFDKLSFR